MGWIQCLCPLHKLDIMSVSKTWTTARTLPLWMEVHDRTKPKCTVWQPASLKYGTFFYMSVQAYLPLLRASNAGCELVSSYIVLVMEGDYSLHARGVGRYGIERGVWQMHLPFLLLYIVTALVWRVTVRLLLEVGFLGYLWHNYDLVNLFVLIMERTCNIVV